MDGSKPKAEKGLSSSPPGMGSKTSPATVVNHQPPLARSNRRENWPEVDSELQPFVSQYSFNRYGSQGFIADEEQRKMHKNFISKRSRLVSLRHDSDITSLHLYSTDGETFITPKRVMVDTGADVMILVSPKIANRMGLTWQEGSAQLTGVGGTGAAWVGPMKRLP